MTGFSTCCGAAYPLHNPDCVVHLTNQINELIEKWRGAQEGSLKNWRRAEIAEQERDEARMIADRLAERMKIKAEETEIALWLSGDEQALATYDQRSWK